MTKGAEVFEPEAVEVAGYSPTERAIVSSAISLKRIAELMEGKATAEHEKRVTDLLNANTELVERARRAESERDSTRFAAARP
jgi:hypothetical protein